MTGVHAGQAISWWGPRAGKREFSCRRWNRCRPPRRAQLALTPGAVEKVVVTFDDW